MDIVKKALGEGYRGAEPEVEEIGSQCDWTITKGVILRDESINEMFLHLDWYGGCAQLKFQFSRKEDYTVTKSREENGPELVTISIDGNDGVSGIKWEIHEDGEVYTALHMDNVNTDSVTLCQNYHIPVQMAQSMIQKYNMI